MLNLVKLYGVTLVAFFAIDMLWLGVIARGFYRKHLGFLMAPTTNWVAAIIFYLLFILGIVFFVVLPGLEAQSLRVTLLRAALYGLITYATYDLTNLATLKDWPVLLTVVDITWGVVLSTLVSLAGYFAGRWLL
ncbi:MAG: DUF2177 family protein [Anaerolineaceae bacterium]|nr:DUF2177 family protein [Anaerolineaceae bacterium]